MKQIFSNRMLVAAAIGAMSLVGISLPIHAEPPQQVQGQQERPGTSVPTNAQPQQGQKRQEQKKAQHQQQPGRPPASAQAQPQQGQRRPGQGKAQQHQQQPARPGVRVPTSAQSQPQQAQRQQRQNQTQQQQINQQQQRLAQYGEHLDQQRPLAMQHAALLKQQNRTAQYRFQEQYSERLRQQQVHLQNSRNYDYSRDPYFSTPPSYRYSWDGSHYETNRYGANLLRQAVNYGYGEGFRAGRADHQDRWGSSYQDSYAYQDANYGYDGYYVDRDSYNYYFREGFRRGYEDGYNSRHQYGGYSGGAYAVSSPVLSLILNFESLR